MNTNAYECNIAIQVGDKSVKVPELVLGRLNPKERLISALNTYGVVEITRGDVENIGLNRLSKILGDYTLFPVSCSLKKHEKDGGSIKVGKDYYIQDENEVLTLYAIAAINPILAFLAVYSRAEHLLRFGVLVNMDQNFKDSFRNTLKKMHSAVAREAASRGVSFPTWEEVVKSSESAQEVPNQNNDNGNLH